MNTASAFGNGSEALARWSLRVLGGFELGVLPGGNRVASLGKRERVLLAYLALSPNCRAVADDGLDCRSSFELAFDRAEDAAFLS